LVIHWLIQNDAAHPGLVRGEAPHGLLSAKETAALDRFTVLKRRQDWLLGRWTAKLLLQEVVRQEHGQTLDLDQIMILPGKDGAPRVKMVENDDAQPLRATVSISHSHGTSLCAAILEPAWPLGADIELVEPRAERFAADFYTAEEQAAVMDAGPERRDMLITAVWSGKEAALKAIREGLRSDTRSVSCHFDDQEPQGGGWAPFEIRWQKDEDRQRHPTLDGWWMVQDGFVCTLAVETENGNL
jgi:4'-phosphopantetheinyl transferase